MIGVYKEHTCWGGLAMFVEVPDDVGSDDEAHQRFLNEQAALYKVDGACSLLLWKSLTPSRLQKRLLKNRKRKKPSSAPEADDQGGGGFVNERAKS